MTAHVALIDRSTVASTGEVDALARALTIQCRHLARVGYPIAADVGVYGHRDVPRGAWQLVILDDTDQVGALGYHDRNRDGRPVAFAFARTAAEAGLAWTVTVSHELVETLVDPWALLGVDLGHDQSGAQWWLAWEACDPCEADADGYAIGGIAVSDFVTPAWFVDGAPGPYDWCEHITEPLTLRPGGYASVQVNGEWSQVTAEETSRDGVSRAEFSHRVLERSDEGLVQRRTIAADHLLRVRKA